VPRTVSNVKAKSQTGGTGSVVVPPKTDYETVRIGEIQSRKTLYDLRIKRLQGQLLDRAEVAREFGSMVSAIKAVIQQSEMPRSIKQDVFAQLLSIADFTGTVTKNQTREESEADSSPALNSGIDQEI